MASECNANNNKMNELCELIQNEIPDGRERLRESNSNLELVANYCEDNYFKTEDKRAALEVTKNYTTQSLAHVAYQINVLAFNLIHMLDLQGTQLAEMESQINHIDQTVSIHKEKIARREIGILTVNRNTTRQHKILIPASLEKSVKYTRRPIDYSVLDDIGHGTRISSTTSILKSKRLSGQTHLNGSMTLRPRTAPNVKPPTPPGTLRSGSLSRASKDYRTPVPPVAPPQVPSNYAPNYPIGHPKGPSDSSRRGSGYSTLPLGMVHTGSGSGAHLISQAMQKMQVAQQNVQSTQPQTRAELQHYQQVQQLQQPQHPHQQPRNQSTYGIVNPQFNQQQPQPGLQRDLRSEVKNDRPTGVVNPSPTPPLPPPPQPAVQEISEDQTSQGGIPRGHETPPLPPPPPIDENSELTSNPNDWIPKKYLEKVIAVYDYVATREDELSFSENSVIYVINKNEDGWYEGVMEGVTGLFPGNYVEPCI
ncbi:abl interactor 2-like [Brevipalpus obovatus]|uniref:abl interactor 2-like n=1 Tax=Brevipalpus obovatus TaxID=246614 RepID=UPI003D9FA946